MSIIGDALLLAAAGGSSWTKLAEAEYTVNTTSTSATLIGTINLGSAGYTADRIIYVKVRDKAGKRAGYFVGSDSFFFNHNAANMGSTANSDKVVLVTRYPASAFATSMTTGTSGYGVYPYSISSSGELTMYRRYNQNNSGTINGTYKVEVYALDYAPNQGNPYNYSY